MSLKKTINLPATEEEVRGMKTGYTLCRTFDRASGRRPRRYYPLHRIQGLQKVIEVWGRTMAFEVAREDALGSFMGHE